MCYLRLCSQHYIVVHVELETTMLAYSTEHITKFLDIQLVRCHV